MAAALLLTCEHASNRVPAGVREALGLSARTLASHRAYDAGAAGLARGLAAELHAPLIAGRVSRLVVDLNRSPAHPAVASRRLPAAVRAALCAQHHAPHWSRVRDAIAAARRDRRQIVHVGVHSFTPVLHGVRRPMDIGLLYDPARPAEVAVARAWKAALAREGTLVVRRNAPYRGVSDGLTRALRREYPDFTYAGLELEVNQALLVRGRFPAALQRVLATALREVLAGPHPFAE